LQVPASQQVPAVHDEMPLHITVQLDPPHRIGAGQALIPAHVILFVMPCSMTPPGHADAPAQFTVQSLAVQVTPVVHELEPQETVQLAPPQVTELQLDAALQSTLHEAADVQSTAALAPPVTRTEHGTPAGHLHPPADPTPQAMVQVPAVQLPPSQRAAQLASPRTGASDAAEPSMFVWASPESPASRVPPSLPGEAPSWPPDPASPEASLAALLPSSPAPLPSPST
jgi:hypothetical protein